MSNHLSQDQLSMWILGRSTAEELRHGRECPQCRAELARFEAPVAAFRSAMLEWSDRESAPRIEEVLTVHHRPQVISKALWHWVAVGTAALLLTAIPIYRQTFMQRSGADLELPSLPPVDPSDESGENADAMLMDAVNAHLSRTIPAPMEPIMALIPTPDNVSQKGGTQ